MPRGRVFLVTFFCGVVVLSLAQFRSAWAAEERAPVGVSQVKHQHRHGVSVALSDYTNEEINYPSREKVRRSRKAGDAGWREASVHESRNVGTSEEHLMRIELKY
jgi:hypothetical protein